jgi:hypothetical protein
MEMLFSLLSDVSCALLVILCSLMLRWHLVATGDNIKLDIETEVRRWWRCYLA